MLKKTMRLVQQSFTRWHLSLQEKEKMCVRVIFRDDLVQSLLSEVTPDEQAAISYSEKHGYKIAYSNPAFEYWYLLHFEKRNGYLKDSATVIDILKNKGYLENYGKSVDVFEELHEHQPEAIQYAKERVERLTRDQLTVICRDSNPVTTVYELVEFLNSKRT